MGTHQIEGQVTAIGSAVVYGNSIFYFTMRQRLSDHLSMASMQEPPIEGLFAAPITISAYLAVTAPGDIVEVTASDVDDKGVREVTAFKRVSLRHEESFDLTAGDM